MNAQTPGRSLAQSLVDVAFDLDTAKTTAKMARVYLPGNATDIANTANPHGVLKGQTPGSTVIVVLDVSGNPDPNSVAVFNITNAMPNAISLKVSNGPTSTHSLLVV